jgi:hypothetical protein
MTSPQDSSPNLSGRYRFRGSTPLDPNEIRHPEMESAQELGSSVPDTANALLAMQQRSAPRPEKPVKPDSLKVKQVLELISSLDTSAGEDQQIALAIIRHHEDSHDGVVKDLRDDPDADHSQIVAWAIDADRLMRCRLLLENVDMD